MARINLCPGIRNRVFFESQTYIKFSNTTLLYPLYHSQLKHFNIRILHRTHRKKKTRRLNQPLRNNLQVQTTRVSISFLEKKNHLHSLNSYWSCRNRISLKVPRTVDLLWSYDPDIGNRMDFSDTESERERKREKERQSCPRPCQQS